MAYSQILEQRLRDLLAATPHLTEKKMFGGIAFMVQGNMAVGVHADRLIVRVGTARYAELVAQPHAAPFGLTGRTMSGWLEVLPEGIQDPAELEKWVRLGMTYAAGLPAK